MGHSTDPRKVAVGEESQLVSIIMANSPMLALQMVRRIRHVGLENNLRVATWNIGSMSERTWEVVEVMIKRIIDICCLQETRWREAVQVGLVVQERGTSSTGKARKMSLLE